MLRPALVALALTLTALAIASPQASHAGGTLTVTRGDDPPPNGCTFDDCSLREAVIDANATQVRESIVIPPLQVTLSRAGADSTAQLGDLDITDSVTIIGAGADVTVLDANGISAVFDVPTTAFPEPAPVSVLIQNVTITGSVDGPGVFSAAESLVLDHVLVTGNENDNDGGGVVGRVGLVTVRDSEISDNTAEFTGGGLDVRSLVIENSTVARNQSGEGGGGISASGITMVNTTVADNTGGGDFGGGGLVIDGDDSLIPESTITNSTFTGNHDSGEGGGVFAASAADVTMTNTVLWDNTASPGPECSGNFAGGRNIVKLASGCTLAGDVTSDDPLLFPLGDYGGPTVTRGIPLDSPARDSGDDAACPSTDQRGIPRPQHTQFCDIGAYEYMFLGDVDCSGTVETGDLLAELEAIAGLGDPACIYRGDLDCSRTLTGLDALFIARHVAPVDEQPRNLYCPAIGPDA